ncbi:type IV toxin-antitoxin system AbiEi family antitoxin domain-containing protein [Bradyrhizobium sp. Leo121]|uniref:type IV toxin-antitoxin system AbiEi family antitoxin domain-containing protein n=1 Tax=Bradyrhizobium sp. Leo121 TaxID=1571195 RepID=UPI001FE1EDBB|nr:type IV toxin-antitoxin system AbiEi family antitoxin domain-containing protein [Bradyrhizobium sp. Leo121]
MADWSALSPALPFDCRIQPRTQGLAGVGESRFSRFYRHRPTSAPEPVLQGHAHYLQLGSDPVIYLYGADVPAWLLKLRVDARFVHRSDTLFGPQPVGVEDAAFSRSDNDDSELALSPWRWPIRMSSPERAILETLDELPAHESFQTVDKQFESLVSLRPKALNQLLEQCRSIKVKRLFFIYADKYAHPWRKHIDTADIDLGRGDRMRDG